MVFIEGVTVYMERVGGVPQEETITAMQQILKLSPAEEIIFAHEIRARRAEELGEKRGRELGEKRGRELGKLEEARELVSRLLTHRFGPLSATVTKRLQSAAQSELEEMALRVLTAATLEEVLGKPKRKRR